MINLILIVETIVLAVLAVSLAVLVSSYQKILKSFYSLKKNKVSEEDRKKVIERLAVDFGRKLELAFAGMIAASQKAVDDEIGKLRDKLSVSSESLLSDMAKKAADAAVVAKEGTEAAVASEFEKAKLDIEEYKRRKLAEIETHAREVLAKVTKDALKEELDPQKQQELVLKALEDAKQQHLL